MNNVYLALEIFGSVILLTLLLANMFENKRNGAKKNVFTRLLALNLFVVACDSLSWIEGAWKNMEGVLWFLSAVIYIVPIVSFATFAKYLYLHISERTQTRKILYDVLVYYSILSAVITGIICITGQMYSVTDGVFKEGPLENLYYLFYVLGLAYTLVIIIYNFKVLGIHDFIGAVSFCLIPLIAIIISVATNINLAVPSLPILMVVIFILLQSEGVVKLQNQVLIDELTGCYNRRAYEDDLLQFPSIPPEKHFVYSSIDINGLKQVNDNLGHDAGDELIKGAAYCLKRTFGNYGKVYRIGGDEFVAMFFADKSTIENVVEDATNMTYEWKGNIVDSLSMSMGVVSKDEFPNKTVEEMALIADQRMYQEKEFFYSNQGVDRRGQNEAHKVLCSLYTKILKVNLTNDSFVIVNAVLEELIKSKGYSDRISEWLEGFGKSGMVHPSDLEEYLAKTNMNYMRNFFKRGKKSLTVIYNRKYDDGFRKVIMEIIPTTDYADDYQTVFIYVKDIDL